jgi:RND family efflux transporter MFP subunit
METGMDASLKRKLLIFPPIVLGVAVLGYQFAFKEPPEQKPPAELVRHVRVIEAVETDIVPRAVGYGSVKPARVWDAVAQVSGRVEFVHAEFKKGAILKAGTEIVRISPIDYEIAIKQANANIRLGDAKLKELGVAEQNARNTLKIEQRSLEIKKQELARAKKLLLRGTAAQATVDQEQTDLLAQTLKVQNLMNTLDVLPLQRAAQEEQIAVYQTQLDTAELDLRRTSIKLPFDGRIAEANVEITQYVGVGTALGSLDGMQTAEVDAQIPQSRFSKLIETMAEKSIRTGVTPETISLLTEQFGLHAIVRLRFDDRAVEWLGRVVRISDTVDPKTRTVGAIVAVDNAYARAVPGRRPPLVKGMFVEVELRIRPLLGKIVVPRSALHAGQLYIVDSNDRLEVRPARTSLVQGDLAVISSGLKPGENLVVSDLSPAIPGMALKTTTDTGLAKRIVVEATAKGAIR